MKQLLAGLCAGTMVVALAACGSSSTASNAGSSTSASRQQARLALAQCLRAHGLNVPDPGSGGAAGGPGGGGGVFRALQNQPQTKLQAARQACKSQFAAAFPRLNVSPAQQAQFRAQLVKFAECMRSHGVDVPDPQISSTGGGFLFRQRLGSVDRNSPAFRTALTACQSLRPRFGGGGPGGPGGGPGA